MKNGILIVDKPEDYTSHDVVARLRGILKTKKIGHTGTLDPFATGVLVMLVGKATRLAQFLDKDKKSYEAVIRFGFETDTGDKTGERREETEGNEGEIRELTVPAFTQLLPEFMGEIEQIPPMYSAKKIKGKKLYELAREGREVERKPIEVIIYEMQLNQSNLQEKQDPETKTQDFRLFVTCSAGTYIRTLAEDIGRKIGVPCHLEELRRTKAGKFELERAVTLEGLEKIVEEGRLDEVLVSMNEAVSHLAEKRLDENEVKRIKNGVKVGASFEGENVQIIRLTDAEENLVAIGECNHETEQIQPRIVFLD